MAKELTSVQTHSKEPLKPTVAAPASPPSATMTLASARSAMAVALLPDETVTFAHVIKGGVTLDGADGPDGGQATAEGLSYSRRSMRVLDGFRLATSGGRTILMDAAGVITVEGAIPSDGTDPNGRHLSCGPFATFDPDAPDGTEAPGAKPRGTLFIYRADPGGGGRRIFRRQVVVTNDDGEVVGHKWAWVA